VLDAPFIERHIDIESLHVSMSLFFVQGILDFFLIPNSVSGIILSLPTSAIGIVFGCNGLESLILFFSGILAYPGIEWRTRLYWLALGYSVLTFINIIRLAFLAWVNEFYKPWFDFLHAYVTESMMIFLALLLFIYYMKKNDHSQKSVS